MLRDLQQIPELAQHVFSDLVPTRQRELLSGIGKAMQPHLETLEAKLSQAMFMSFSSFSSVVEDEFRFFCKSLDSLDAYSRGSWAQVEGVLNSDECLNLRLCCVGW